VIEVDVGHHLVDGFTAGFRLPETDQERPALLHGGHVPGNPGVALQEQVLVLVEAE
jgi:hypothetical protein